MNPDTITNKPMINPIQIAASALDATPCDDIYPKI